MPRFLITEPHPTVAQNAYTHSGRGGAGNTFRAPETTPASGVPTTASTYKSSSSRFYSGRGGAGNAHAVVDRPHMSFDDEYSSAAAREKSTSGFTGRGGAGNAYYTNSGSDRRDSASTDGSVRSGFFARFSMGSR